MADTNATYNTSITADFPDYASSIVKFTNEAFFISGNSEILAGKQYTLTLDANGQGTQLLPCPDNTGDAAVNWLITLPSKESGRYAISYDAASQNLSDILAAGSTTTDPDNITAALANKASKVNGGTTDNIVTLTADGDIQDGGTALSTVTDHIADTSNPHSVTAAQVGAVALAGDTMTGQLNFSGTDHAGVKLLSLTSVQRDALTAAVGMTIWNTTDGEMQYYDGSYWRNSADGARRPYYRQHDRFTTQEANPLTTPRTAEPGPGTWLITDTVGRLSINALGELYVNSGGTSRSDPVLHGGTGFTAQDGLCFYCRWRQDFSEATPQGIATFGWATSQAGELQGNRFRATAGNIQMANQGSWFGASYTTLVSGYTALVDYEFAIIMDGSFANYYIRGGEFENWLYLGQNAQGAATTVYPALNSYNRPGVFSRAAVVQLPNGWTIDDLDYLLDTQYTVSELQGLFASNMRHVEIERSGSDYIFKQRQGRGEVRWFFNSWTDTISTINVLEDCEWWENGAKVASLHTGGSVWEYATNKSGGSFMGNAHGNDNQTALTIFVDGVDRSAMADGTSYNGLEIVVTRTSALADGTNNASVTTTYTINHETGLTVNVSYNWTLGSNPGGWDQMMPFDALFDTARLHGLKNYDMDAVLSGALDDGNYNAAIVFERNGNYAMLFVPGTERYGYILKASPNKLYSQIDGVDVTEANYRAARFANASIFL